jgi:hypothetical protein
VKSHVVYAGYPGQTPTPLAIFSQWEQHKADSLVRDHLIEHPGILAGVRTIDIDTPPLPTKRWAWAVAGQQEFPADWDIFDVKAHISNTVELPAGVDNVTITAREVG